GLTTGGVLARYFIARKNIKVPKIGNSIKEIYIKRLRFVSLGVFLLTYPFYFIRLFERLLYRLQTSYYAYYANFESKLPYFTYILSTFTV
ncbi:O-antigen polysaccharide polymerase Wzy family protein, partial [Faecalimonas umbilicata]|nr:O-antigen polysaccharide polymerase Wzy family protein [Faecalimonas umbilicata]